MQNRFLAFVVAASLVGLIEGEKICAFAGMEGKICLVTGASKGIGRGIAIGLGSKGARVYITGRDQKTLQETAKEVTDAGGEGRAVVCDHSDPMAIKALFEKIERDEKGLDVLVNNCYSAVNDIFTTSDKKFWEKDLGWWDKINDVGLKAHFVASQLAVPLMIPRSTPENPGLIVTVSSAGGSIPIFDVAYGVGKAAKDRLASDMAGELKGHNIASISLWPGAVWTEKIQTLTADDVKKNGEESKMQKIFGGGNTESTLYSGKAVAALAMDKKNLMSMTGRTLLTGDLGDKYGFTEDGGKRIHSFRSIKALLLNGGLTTAAAITPGWIKIPTWVMALATNKF